MATDIARVTAVHEGIKGDTVPLAISDEWVGFFYTVYGPIIDDTDPENPVVLDYADLSNSQKAAFQLNHLRRHYREVRNAALAKDAANAAAATVRAETVTEADADFGVDDIA
jgi:hypothetical protein